MRYSNGLLNFKNENKQQVIIKGEKGDPRVGFKLTQDGNYGIQNKKLTNVTDGTDPNDANTKQQLDSIGHGTITKDIDLGIKNIVKDSKTRTGSELGKMIHIDAVVRKSHIKPSHKKQNQFDLILWNGLN